MTTKPLDTANAVPAPDPIASAVSTVTTVATTAETVATDIETVVGDVAQAATVITKANAWTALVGLLTALPGLVQLGLQLWAWVNKVSGGNPGTFIANFGVKLGALMAAKTKEDRNNATSDLATLISREP